MAIILTKKSDTASSVPLVADLTNAAGGAELAVNTADKRLFTKTSGGTVVELGTNPSSMTLPNGTANGVPYLNGSKVLTSGTALTFDGTNLGVGTASPQAKVHAVGAVLSSGALVALSASNIFVDQPTSALSRIGVVGANTSTYGTLNISQYSSNGSLGRDALTLSAEGNLGLGVTPSAWGSSYKAIDIAQQSAVFGASGALYFSNNAYFNSSSQGIYKTTAAAQYMGVGPSGGFTWNLAPSGTAGNAITFTQAMTLDASGNLLVGKTAANNTDLGVTIYKNGTTSGRIEIVNGASGGTAMQAFYYSSGASIGSISGTNTTTTYNTSSDYRLKENIQPMTGALAKVAALKPVTYTWKVDGSAGEGFIAHELAEVCPAAVTGEKDAMRTEQYEISPAVPATFDAEGNELTPAAEAVMGERQVPDYQGIDVSFLVGTLTAAIQELKAEFDAYKAAHP